MSVLAGLVLAGLQPAVAVAHVKEGQPAPPFTLYTFAGTKVTSTELAGKVVILNYWATWCGPCKREMVVFDRYVRTHPDLKVFAVQTEDSLPHIYLYQLSAALAFPLASSVRGSGYGAMEGLPTSYVIDRAGVIRHAQDGAFNDQSLDKLVAPLLAAPAPGAAQPAAAATAPAR